MKIQLMTLRPRMLLVACLFLVACAEIEPSRSQAKGLLMADAAGTLSSKLLNTSVDGSSAASKWFCSFYTNETFLSRSTIQFLGNSKGFLNALPVKWATEGEASIAVSGSNWAFEITDILFSDRASINDTFVAQIDTGSNVICDWSGSSRLGSVLLSDGSSSEDRVDYLTDESEGDFQFEIESLLLTSLNANTHNASWKCVMSRNQEIVDNINYYFYPSNKGYAAFDFIWLPHEDGTITIRYPEAEYKIENLKFGNETNSQFTAYDSRGYDLSCNWRGEERVSAYSEI